MGFFSRKKKEESTNSSNTTPKGFYSLEVKSIQILTPESVKISFQIPAELKAIFSFTPGQYLNLCAVIEGIEERRSYSICSGQNEDISVAIKRINNGKFSNWANEELKVGDTLLVAPPLGNFQLDPTSQKIVAFAAGSGITPLISMAKKLEITGGRMNLFYGNRTINSILFHTEIEALKSCQPTYFLSGENQEGFRTGRIDQQMVNELIKEDLSLLKADGFYLCGPEAMIKGAMDSLLFFGVAKEKIHFELYTSPVLLEEKSTTETIHFEGESTLTVQLDDEQFELKLHASGKTILDAINKEGYDAPYSCRGGVCCTCRAKVLKGKVTMNLNYSLTDQEVAEGYILTCQAHPASSEVTISYDV